MEKQTISKMYFNKLFNISCEVCKMFGEMRELLRQVKVVHPGLLTRVRQSEKVSGPDNSQ